ncbi:DNA polymerase II [Parasalinivibrio latis]|uniref:DNA polymerase II n=1 Tax=Parasalinivibrio latis TaxID=2952610 RepID=UPI0030E0727C
MNEKNDLKPQVKDGFLLTRESRDTSNGMEIRLWVKSGDCAEQLVISGEKPVFFVASEKTAEAMTLLHAHNLFPESKPLPLTSFEHAPVTAFYFPTSRLASLASDLLIENDFEPLESDIRPADRYLMERYIQGGLSYTGTPVTQKGIPVWRQARIKQADYKPDLVTVSLDIECSERGELYSVGLDCVADSRVIMIGPEQDGEEFTHIEWVVDEKALLISLENWFATFEPDVVIGWNVIDFDFRLLAKAAERQNSKLKIGRGGEYLYVRERKQGGSFVTLPGRVLIDGIDALKTATYGFRSWSLESVAQELLGEGKAISNPYDRLDEIKRMFREDKRALAKYNLQDCVLVNRIFDHTHLLEFLIERSRLTGVELDRVGGSVAAFTNLYLPRLHRGGYVAPNLHAENWIASPGGYVMDSLPGLYDSVLVLDFKSLYPSIIKTFRIDPMGLIEGLKAEEDGRDRETIPGFRGGVFHREKHYLPAMIEGLWSARDRAKQQGEKAFSTAIKIIMNSFYGVLGSSGCRFFDHRLASSITMRGHEIMKQTREFIENRGYQVIYGDTDSTFVALGSLHSQKDADNIGNELATDINVWWTQRLRDEYDIGSALEIEYETHYRKFLMPKIRGQDTGSKKRYAGLVGEGENEKMVFKGLESARTDWTPLSQAFQQELYHRVFHGQDIDELVREYAENTLNGNNDDRLFYRKRLRRKLAEYQVNVPPHVRAARMADEVNKRLGRQQQYQFGGWIEYAMTVNGPEPKEALQSPLDYQHYVDKQLRPIADGILPFIGKDFDNLASPQLGLF